MLSLSYRKVILLRTLNKRAAKHDSHRLYAGPRILVAIDIAKAKHEVLVELPTGKRRKMIARNQLSDFRQFAA